MTDIHESALIQIIDLATVDLNPRHNSLDDSTQWVQQLDAACRDHGFFLLKGHGLNKDIAAMWEHSQTFFNQTTAVKRQIERSEKRPLGYYDRELTKLKRDQKEVFDFMAERDTPGFNQWPEQSPDFKHAMLDFFAACDVLANRTLELIFHTLGLTADESAQYQGHTRTSNMRLNYYPVADSLTPQEQTEVNALGDMALHHHTDPGILTLLVQDQVGGLQTLSKTAGWIDIPPVADTIVVNLGDALQVWTNDRYQAAVHRVTPVAQARYSTPFFYNPGGRANLSPISSLVETAPKYRAFTWKEYITHRTTDNYKDLGADDTQISHYRI